MEIYSFDMLPSTQQYLVEAIRANQLIAPVAIITSLQSAGVGSRDNQWSGGEGNFFASVAIPVKSLPDDLSLASASLYFAQIMLGVLRDFGEPVWLKWPNDFYLATDKIGGVITQKIDTTLVCGIGINLRDSNDGYKGLGGNIESQNLLEKYLIKLNEFPSWKHLFREYQVEFEHNKAFSFHFEDNQKSLQHALLCEDGSLIIDGKRVFSLR